MEQQASTLVAVYGTLRLGQGNHHVMEVSNGEYLGTTRLPGTIRAGQWSGFPYLTLEHPGEKGEFTAEVFRIPDGNLTHLDRLEGYPSFYNRSVVSTKFGDAWIYHIEDEHTYAIPAIEGGDWNTFLEQHRSS